MSQALLIDEFLGMLNAKGDLRLTFRPAQSNGRREVLFHAHCHQKAAAAPARSVELLRLAGYEAEMADAPGCGMAGAYGYEKEHYEASRAAGERNLFPLIRAQAEAQVAVMGTACRQQIEHFTGRRARHVVDLIHGRFQPGDQVEINHGLRVYLRQALQDTPKATGRKGAEEGVRDQDAHEGQDTLTPNAPVACATHGEHQRLTRAFAPWGEGFRSFTLCTFSRPR